MDGICSKHGKPETFIQSLFAKPEVKKLLLRCMLGLQDIIKTSFKETGQKGVVYLCVISGFLQDVDEICALLECYAVQRGNYVQTFRDNLSVPSS